MENSGEDHSQSEIHKHAKDQSLNTTVNEPKCFFAANLLQCANWASCPKTEGRFSIFGSC